MNDAKEEKTMTMPTSTRRGFFGWMGGAAVAALSLDKLLGCGEDVPPNLPPLPSGVHVVDSGNDHSLEEQPALAEEVDYTDQDNNWLYTHTMENNGEEGGAYSQPFPGNIGAASGQSIRTSYATRMDWNQLLNEYHGVAGETAVALEDGTTLGDKLRELYVPVILQIFPAISAMYGTAETGAEGPAGLPAEAAPGSGADSAEAGTGTEAGTDAGLLSPEQVAVGHLDALLTNLPKHDRFVYFGRITFQEQDPETGAARQVAYLALPFIQNGNPTYGLVVDGFAVENSLGQPVSQLHGVEQVVAAAEYASTGLFGGE